MLLSVPFCMVWIFHIQKHLLPSFLSNNICKLFLLYRNASYVCLIGTFLVSIAHDKTESVRILEYFGGRSFLCFKDRVLLFTFLLQFIPVFLHQMYDVQLVRIGLVALLKNPICSLFATNPQYSVIFKRIQLKRSNYFRQWNHFELSLWKLFNLIHAPFDDSFVHRGPFCKNPGEFDVKTGPHHIVMVMLYQIFPKIPPIFLLASPGYPLILSALSKAHRRTFCTKRTLAALDHILIACWHSNNTQRLFCGVICQRLEDYFAAMNFL